MPGPPETTATAGIVEAAQPGKRPETIPALVADAAARFGAAEALVDGETRMTFAELDEKVAAMARALTARGLRHGDRVGVWGPNSWEWAVAALGVHAAGCVVVPVNTRFKGDEAAHVLGRARARMLFTVSGFLGIDYVEMLRAAAQGAPSSLEETVVMRGAASAGTTAFEDLMASGANRGAPIDRALRPSRAVTPVTSCSPRAPPGSPKAWCSPTRPPAGPIGAGPR